MRLLTACAAFALLSATTPARAAEAADDAVETLASEASAPVVAASPLVSEAAPYAIFYENVRSVPSAGFASVEELDVSLSALGGYDPEDLASSWLAYSALIAVQDAEFIDAVREVADSYGRKDTLSGLSNDPKWVAGFPGADRARVTIATATNKDVRRLMEAGDLMDRETGRLKEQAWSKKIFKDNSARLALLRSAAPTRTASADILAGLSAPISLGKRAKDADRQNAAQAFWGVLGYAPTGPAADGGFKLASDSNYAVNQALALAAYQALDATNAAEQSGLSRLLSQTDASECLAIQRKQLLSCVGGVASHADEANCLAKHSLRGVGSCFSQVATR